MGRNGTGRSAWRCCASRALGGPVARRPPRACPACSYDCRVPVETAFDLHTHSVVSDGTESPAEVVRQAAAAGLGGLALTDHDSTAGWADSTSAAREAGMEVLGISLVTNLAAGISPTPLHHSEVLEAGLAAAPQLRSLLSGLADRL